jgi:hypothetical protein
LFACLGCKQQPDVNQESEDITALPVSTQTHFAGEKYGKGALLLTRFSSFDEFKNVVHVEYTNDSIPQSELQEVRLTYASGGMQVTSILKSGISQTDFLKAKGGNLADKVVLAIKCPFAILNKKGLTTIENLGRRRPWIYGKGDSAFYDLADMMVQHIREEDLPAMSCEDLDEKGFLNTFNHITAQAFMTSLYSEEMADFVADVHELYNMPELITGKFTEQQLAHFETGPADNYVDMLNNEWGQELGKTLREKYAINSKTFWSPGLLANYLNDVQAYYSWAFQIGFTPFRPTDDMVMQFSWKMNRVSGVRDKG